MNLRKKLLVCQTLLVILGAAAPSVSYAYVDPGSVSLLIQGLIGALAAAGAAASLWWSNIKSFFRGKKAAKPEETKDGDGRGGPAAPGS